MSIEEKYQREAQASAEIAALKIRYPDKFYKHHQDGSINSAARVWPLVFQYVNPQTIIDVGCGIGTWLYVAQQYGKEITGLDFYPKEEDLLIPPERFIRHNLSHPIQLTGRFDLAVCLETGEAIPNSASGTLVRSLCGLSDVILFSAAIPNQGGTFHINEQWPEFWRSLFALHGYVPVDCLRERIWNDNGIESWYRQNIMFYVSAAKVLESPWSTLAPANPAMFRVIHPSLWEWKHYQWTHRKDVALATKVLEVYSWLRRKTR